MRYRRLIPVIAMILCYALPGMAQNYSDDVQFVSGDENQATVTASAVSAKKKDAGVLAVKSAFNCLFHSGVDGLKGGTPMLLETKRDYDYRFFSEGKYISYIVGEPETNFTQKTAGMQHASVTLTINLKTLRADLTRNRQALSPAWADAKKQEATTALNPTIVVVPYADESTGYSFADMRRRIEHNSWERYAVERMAEAFQKHGFKTRDFIAMLQNSKNNNMLREGTHSDIATMMARELPGDIVVTIGVHTQSQGNTTRVGIETNAVEKQTSGRLATKTFQSSYYHTTDTTFLVGAAINTIEDDFFAQLTKSFEDMINKGREVNLDINLSETVSDWDFEQDGPASGEYFKDALDEWLRENAFHGAYDMSRNTENYIAVRINVPLWNTEKNRSYTLSNFGSDLRKFFKKHLGEDYKASVKAMGQSITVTIE